MAGRKRSLTSVRLASKFALWRLNAEGRLVLIPAGSGDVEPITVDTAKVELRRLIDERYRELGRFPRAGESVERVPEG